MITKKYYKTIIFLSIFIVIALFITFNLDSTKNFIEKDIGIYSYPAILIFSFLTDFIVQPIGPEVPGSLALILGLKFSYVFFLTLIGSYIGSSISYLIGRKILFSDIEKFYKKKSRKKYKKMFKKHGKFALFISSISPVPYVLFCWLAGAFKITTKEFILFGIFPRTLRIWVILSIVNLFL